MINRRENVVLPNDTNVEHNGRGQKIITDPTLFKNLVRFDSSFNKLKI